jgi:hypothetical protein
MGAERTSNQNHSGGSVSSTRVRPTQATQNKEEEMRARSVSVSLYQQGGELRIWCTTFTLKGSLPTKDGKIDEVALHKKQREIEKLLESVEFPE